MTDRHRPQTITVHDKMQDGYTYELTRPAGRNFSPRFTPDLTPQEMLGLGVFGGVYMRDCSDEFPDSWFRQAKLAPEGVDEHLAELNYFGINASQSLSEWRRKGWINNKHDPRGWFQWYCRYYRGRRLEEEDARQIGRWQAYRRHLAQVEKNCEKGDMNCRRRQRQSLLHWAYDTRA